jgi:MoxR-like ATPase
MKNLPTVEEITNISSKLNAVIEKLNQALFGRDKLHRMMLIAILAKGHVLLEGLPGLGKTALVNCLGQLLQLQFKRIQFTPDIMPGDILGSHILQENYDGKREMKFSPGPIFTNIVLADEINRASPKTQSALLEAMQEKTVTVLGDQMVLPPPFFVLATQNPIELEGTYPLPEAQIDRFIFKLELSSAPEWVLEKIIKERHRGEIPENTPLLNKDDLNCAFSLMDKIFIPDAVASFIARIVSSTSPDKKLPGISEFIRYGASPRAAISIAEAAKGAALLDGRPSVGFGDVEAVAQWALHHRIILDYMAKAEKISSLEICSKIMKQISAVPNEPRNVVNIC